MNGQKLYDLARKGREVERQPRRITVFDLTRTGTAENGDVLLTVRCSKGTYIRTLCHDVGAALGCGGAMSALRRTRAGAFDLTDAHTLDEVLAAVAEGRAETLLLPVDTLFSRFDAVTLTAAQEKVIRNGGCYTCAEVERTLRLYGKSGEFLALGEVRDGMMRPIKSFFEV